MPIESNAFIIATDVFRTAIDCFTCKGIALTIATMTEYVCVIQVDQMLLDHAWILEEKKYFGHANTAYDFKANDPKEAGRRIQKLQETKDKLSKSVNMRAMNMLGKAEEQVGYL